MVSRVDSKKSENLNLKIKDSKKIEVTANLDFNIKKDVT